MLPYAVWLDRHDIDDDAPAASVCQAAFAAYHDADRYARELAAVWLDETAPVCVRIELKGRNVRYFPLRATTDNY